MPVKTKIKHKYRRVIDEERSSKLGFFGSINNWLNNLSSLQFVLLLVLVLGISIVIHKPILSFSKENPITTSIGNIVEALNCDDSENKLNQDCWEIVPTLNKTNGFTNALLVGIDTRDGQAGLMNTDTIIVASYDHSTGKTLLISFPRDLYVSYKINGVTQGKAKINAIYAAGETSSKSTGMQTLAENIEEYIDLEIHYSALVNFNALTEVVDAIGGIEIELEDDYTDVYPYAELSRERKSDCIRAVDLPAYCVYSYNKGINEFTGEEALIYARMRQYTSDFDRARRQQEVIDAVKNKLLGDETNLFTKATDAWEIYTNVSEKGYVTTEVEFNDIVAGLMMFGEVDTDPLSVVLDPSFGDGLLFPTSVGAEEVEVEDEEGNITTQLQGGIYVLLPRGGTFDNIQDELARIRKNPDLYDEQAKVLVENYSGSAFSADSPYSLIKNDEPFFDTYTAIVGQNSSLLEEEEDMYDAVIILFNPEKQKSADYIKSFFDVESRVKVVTPGENPELRQRSNYVEDIRVEIY